MTETRAAHQALTDASIARSVDLLVFELDRLRLALPVASVREVVRAVAIAPLPHAPPIVEGVINARGTLVPVFDLRRRFDLPPRPLSLGDHLILAWAGPRLAALRVDRADELISVAPGDIEPAEGVVPEAAHVAALARLPDGLVLIHDLARFLSPADAEQVDAALISAGRSVAHADPAGAS